jgi:telomerase reverse transcriptase
VVRQASNNRDIFADCTAGEPLGELKPLTQLNPSKPVVAKAEKNLMSCAQISTISASVRTPGNIVFVRNRMLYARAALNAQGGVSFGLRHIRKVPVS